MPLLIEHFLSIYSRKMSKDVQSISPEAMKLLLDYSWPGNIRELQSVVRQALLQTAGPVITPESLPKSVRPRTQSSSAPSNGHDSGDLSAFIDQRIAAGSQEVYADTLELMERCLLTRVLRTTEGNQSAAAKILGITRASLRHKIQALNISLEHNVTVGQND